MKKVYITESELDDILITLWKDLPENATFACLPKSKKIKIITDNAELLAEISVVKTADSYTIIKELFNQK